MSLFDGFKREISTSDSDLWDSNTSATLNSTNANPEGYYFEDPFELVSFIKVFGKDKSALWLSGDNLYLEQFKMGYDLYEQHQYNEAIEAYKKALSFNPVGIRARFEICEAFIQLKKLKAAKDTLVEIGDFLIKENDIARFYRRMGYIEIENGNYKAAAACYIFSKKFENHPSINQELAYIKSISQADISHDEAETILQQAEIPILTANCEEAESEAEVQEETIEAENEDTLRDEFEDVPNEYSKELFISRTGLDTATLIVRRMKSHFCCDKSVTLFVDDEEICEMAQEDTQELVIFLGPHTIEIEEEVFGEEIKTAFDIMIDDSDTFAFEFVLGEKGRVININA